MTSFHVATTWLLSFQQTEQQAPAADLLRLCAFLAPDDIPLSMLVAGAEHLPALRCAGFPGSESQNPKTERLMSGVAIRWSGKCNAVKVSFRAHRGTALGIVRRDHENVWSCGLQAVRLNDPDRPPIGL